MGIDEPSEILESHDPPWLLRAGSYVGTREVPGWGISRVIQRWAQAMGGWIAGYYTSDEIPWCALFVNQCLREVKVAGTGSLAARSFVTWGIPLSEPARGAIVVFGRPGGGGHVGFYLGENATHVYVRGGNQGDAVADVWVAKSRLLAVRWPLGAIQPMGSRVHLG